MEPTQRQRWKRVQVISAGIAVSSFIVGVLAAICESFALAYILAICFLVGLLFFAAGRIGEAANND